MRILIYGLTDISFLIIKDLCSEHDITVVDEREDLPPRFEKLDINFISGNISDSAVLAAANAKECDLFISCSPYDESNIVAIWAVTRFSDAETVCFVSKLEYFRNIYNNDSYLSDFGIDHVLWAEEALVQEIFRIVSVPEAIYVDYFEGGKARLFEYKIKDDSALINKDLKSCSFPDNTIMLALTRDGELFIPKGSTKLRAGDRPIFIGSPKGLSMLARDLFFTKDDRIDSVAIIGGGNIGLMLAQKLEAVNIKTKILETNRDRCEFLSEKLSKTLVLHSNSLDYEFFEEEEIGESDAVVNVTDNDETNLFCSIMAGQMGAGKIFAKASSDSLIPMFEKAGVDVVLSPERAILNELRNKIINKDKNLLAVVARGQGKLLEIEVPESFDARQIKDLKIPRSAIIGVVRRGRNITIPKGNSFLYRDNKMIVFTKASDSEAVKEFFRRADEA